MERPMSLHDWPMRMQIFVQECKNQGESVSRLATEAGLSVKPFTDPSPLPNSTTLLAIDRISGGHMLTPPELEWAEWQRDRYQRRWQHRG
jgi:hypothetical protein